MIPSTDLWQFLQAACADGRPIVMYGMGNGADKILAVCAHYGIPVADFFASDGFVRGHSFHGKTVLSLAAVQEKYRGTSPIVLLSFASARPEVLAAIEAVASVYELYIPDVPVCGTDLFDAAYYQAHQDEILAARALLADEVSRAVYDGVLAYKLSGRLDVLRATESAPAPAYRDILHAERFRVAADLGAYNGDSIRDLRLYSPDLTDVIALEPDRRNFRKLESYAQSLREEADPLRIHAVQAGAWCENTTLTFHDSGNRNAGLTDAPPTIPSDSPLPSTTDNPYFGKTAAVPAVALDRVVAEMPDLPRHVDYIKYDVEGAEAEALRGSQAIIARDAPALLVSAYHRSADIFALPLLVHKLNPAYRLYLRRMAGVPAWDINLYAVMDDPT